MWVPRALGAAVRAGRRPTAAAIAVARPRAALATQATKAGGAATGAPGVTVAGTTAATAAAAIRPAHIAIPVHSLEAARAFWGGLMGCEEGRSAATWIDWNLYGHQVVTHFVSATYRGASHVNAVDKDMVPVPHMGVVLSVDDFHALTKRLQAAKTEWVVPPTLRFKGKPGEQWTCFFRDPSGNNLEFKAMTNPANLFAKYYVEEEEPHATAAVAAGSGGRK